MALKKIIISKKVDNEIHEIHPKTSADIVTYGESTVEETLNILEDTVDNIARIPNDKILGLFTS